MSRLKDGAAAIELHEGGGATDEGVDKPGFLLKVFARMLKAGLISRDSRTNFENQDGLVLAEAGRDVPILKYIDGISVT